MNKDSTFKVTLLKTICKNEAIFSHLYSKRLKIFSTFILFFKTISTLFIYNEKHHAKRGKSKLKWREKGWPLRLHLLS